jgi:hypothetical protein
MRQVPEMRPVPARLRAQRQSIPARTLPDVVKTWPKPAQMRQRGDPNAAPAINATLPTNCVQARPRDACTQGTCSTRRRRACTRMCMHTTPCARAHVRACPCAYVRVHVCAPYGQAHLRAHRRARVRCGGGSKLLLRRRRTTCARENLQRFPAPDGTAVPAGWEDITAVERKTHARKQTNEHRSGTRDSAAAIRIRKQTNGQQAARRRRTAKQGARASQAVATVSSAGGLT